MKKSATLAKQILPLLLEPKTRAEVSDVLGREVASSYVNAMIKDGLIKPRSVVRTGRRGRPAYILGLTDKGRKRAKRLTVATA